MRSLIFFAVLGAILWAAYDMNRGSNSAEAQDGERTEGYMEVRASMKLQSHDFELVIVEEKPLLAECMKPELAQSIVDSCPAEMQCAITQFSCSGSVDRRYLNMLAGKPGQLHYTHVAMGTPEKPRNAAVVVWGVSQEGAMTVCRSLVSDPKLTERLRARPRCV